MLRARREGVLARPDPVPADARRHRPQLPRGARVPRPPGRRARRPADRGVGPGLDRRGPGGRGDRPAGQPQPAPDHHPARRDRGAQVRRGVRRRPARRGEGPGQGAGLLASATTSASGTRRTSGPSCGASTTAGIRRGEHIRVFPLSNWTELDVWQYIARRGHRDPVDLLRAPARGLPARRHAARRPAASSP